MSKVFEKIYGLEKGIEEGFKTYRKIVNGRPQKPIEQLKKERIYIRVTEEEKKEIEALANLNHKSTSEFIRHLIFNKYANELFKFIR